MRMIERDLFFKYLPLHIVLIIPIPGRFVFGITIVLEHILLTLAGTLINSLVDTLRLKELKTVIIMLAIISASVLFRQILVVTYTEIALTLGYLIFLPAVSLFLIQIVYSDLENPLGVRLRENLIQTAVFSAGTLILFLFRDIAGYGTFTFYSKNHTFSEKILFERKSAGILSFFATLPGILLLVALILFASLRFHEKINREFGESK